MREKLVKLWSNQSLRFTLMSAIASGINFVTLIVFGRVFSVADYGIVTTAQALMANIAVFMIPLQTIICKTLAENGEQKEKQMNTSLNVLLLINLAELVVLLAAGGLFIQYLHFTGLLEYGLFILLIFTNNFYLVLSGAAQGNQDFSLLGIVGILMYGVKMVIGVALALAGMGPGAAILGYAAAELICILLLVRKIRTILKEQLRDYRFKFDKMVLTNYLWSLVLYFVVSLYINNGDLLLGNMYCTQDEIGLYSVAINLSKISVFLIATPIATLLLPKVSKAADNPEEQRKLLYRAEGITLAVSAVYGVCFFLLGRWLIGILYGAGFEGSGDYILPCVVFSTVLGMFWVFYQYAFATDLLRCFTIVTVVTGAVVIGVVMATKCRLGYIPIIMAAAMALTVLIVLLIKRPKNINII